VAMTEEPRTIVCLPWRTDAAAVPGSKLGSCGDCSRRIIVLPAAQATPEARLVCESCALERHPGETLAGELDRLERTLGSEVRRHAEQLPQMPLAARDDRDQEEAH
jgi:hypothetical protein